MAEVLTNIEELRGRIDVMGQEVLPLREQDAREAARKFNDAVLPAARVVDLDDDTLGVTVDLTVTGTLRQQQRSARELLPHGSRAGDKAPKSQQSP